mgnify:CR=1 FL=1
MRLGFNPHKDEPQQESDCFHQVVVPVYIPNEEGYFKDSFVILQYCLQSLFKTSHQKTYFTIVNNGSCDEVVDYLNSLYHKKKIQELIHSTNIGKLNAILKGLTGNQFTLITIADADVLFVNNWQEETYAVFEAFPNAGAVCPVPVFRKHFHLTSNIWFKYLFSKKLYFRAVKNVPALTKFAASIGWPWLDEKWSDTIGTLEASNGKIAVLGCSHFVATYKREVFQELPKENSKFKLGGDSEHLYTDFPVIKSGGYRLSTYDNYAYHLGNQMEPWMIEMYHSLIEVSKKENTYLKFAVLKRNRLEYLFSEYLFKKILYFKPIKRILLKSKGLTPTQINNFTS